MAVDFSIKKDDTSPNLDATLKDAAGTPVNLTGASVKFVMAPVTGGTVKVDLAATVTDPLAGTVSHAWLTAHTDTPGDFYGEFQVTFSGGAIETFPNDRHLLIRILEDLS